MKKIISHTLIVMVLVFTVIAIPGTRDIIDFKNVMVIAILFLIAIFTSSAVIIFIYPVFMKDAAEWKTEFQLTKNTKNVINSYTCL